jgi:hypothetical protein
LRKCGWTNKHQPIAKPIFSSGWTNIAEHFILTSTSVFQSAAAVGGRNTNSTPAAKPCSLAVISRPMRYTIIFGLISLLYSCGSSDKKSFIPKEYDYPDDSLLKGKTFVYQDIQTGEKAYTYYLVQYHLKDKWFLSLQYTNNKVYDSTIYLNDKMIETYSSPYPNGNLLKCEIIQDTLLQNGTRFGRSLKTTVLRKDSNSVISSFVSEFLKDTIIAWRNQNIPCIVTTQKCKDEYKNGKDSTTDTLLYSQNGYYGKGIGLIRYTVYFHDRVTTIELKDIKE